MLLHSASAQCMNALFITSLHVRPGCCNSSPFKDFGPSAVVHVSPRAACGRAPCQPAQSDIAGPPAPPAPGSA
eukprot:1767122-Karenia_brevis.AAC.1